MRFSMTNMQPRLWVFCFLFVMFVQVGLFAGDIHTTIRDVMIRGNSEQVGVFSFLIDGNVFPDASPENPVFVYVALEDGALLSDTKVDIDRPDLDRFSYPIYLPLSTWALVAGAQIVAPADTLAVVRWVKGEAGFWLRVQRPSTAWLTINDVTHEPNADLKILFIVGVSASRYREDNEEFHQQGLANLPFATRDVATTGNYNDAVSTLLCTDLTAARLEKLPATRSKGSLNGLVSVFRAGGVLTAETAAQIGPMRTYPEAFGGPHILARGFDVTCAFLPSIPQIETVSLCDVGSEDVVSFTMQQSITTGCSSWWGVHLNSRYLVTFDPSSAAGFLVQTDGQGVPLDGASVSQRANTVLLAPDSLTNTALGLPFANRDSLFQIGGLWYARNAEALLIERDTYRTLTLSLDLKAYVSGGADPGPLQAEWSVYPTNRSYPEDDDPRFDGPDQYAFCRASEILSGTFRGEVVLLSGCAGGSD